VPPRVPVTKDGGRTQNGCVPAPIRVAIVDDHQLVVDGLATWLREHAADVELRYAGADPAEVLREATELDVVLLDLDLGKDAPPPSQTVRQLAQAGVAVLIVSAHGEPGVVRSALMSGAMGYVPKSSSSTTLLEGIRTVADGRSYVTSELAAIMAEPGSVGAPELSAQELRALRLYASGLKLDTVARRMNVSTSTAKEYLDRVREKYAGVGRTVRTKVELYAAATRDGFIDPIGRGGS
jgi:DNA-binding NarL/FixJ family response regulator